MSLQTLRAQASDCRGNTLSAYNFAPGGSQICTELLTSMGRWDLGTLTAIVMVKAMPRGHLEVTMVPMSVSIADADDVADLYSERLPRQSVVCRRRSKRRQMPAPLGLEQQK